MALRRRAPPDRSTKLVAITFDDGPDFDYYDLPHPAWGTQRSLLNIIRDFQRKIDSSGASRLHATSFVIVSPDARRELDRTCMIGRNWWRDEWWQPAVQTGHLTIGNHSWDHNHPGLTRHESGTQTNGTFSVVDNFQTAELQIARAAALLRAKVPNPGTEFFAYPYGETSDYLVREYFPTQGRRIGICAAFTCDAMPVSESCNVWTLPRYVFGRDWTKPEEFRSVLRDAYGSGAA